MTNPLRKRRAFNFSWVRPLLAVTAVLSGNGFAWGQCSEDWFAGSGLPGISGQVNAQVMWDADGAGPQPARLVVGGQFSVAGSTLVQNVAMWNGSAWVAIGNGLGVGGKDTVYSLIVTSSGQLVAAGSFLNSGSTTLANIARWTGTAWTALGTSSTPDFSGFASVHALANLPSGDLVAGGNFAAVNGIEATSVARWDGSTWFAMPGLDGQVNALAVLSNGVLVAGGSNVTASGEAQNLAQWDGSTWSALDTTSSVHGVNGTVNALVVMPDHALVVGGQFSAAGNITVNNLARFTGSSWSDVGGGVTDPFAGVVTALAVDAGGNLVVGGEYSLAGGANTNSLARWNNISWSAVWSNDNDRLSKVQSILTAANGTLTIAGRFDTASGVPANNVASFDTSWHAFGSGGTNGAVGALTKTFSGDVLAGGNFVVLEGVSTNHVAKSSGSSWANLGSGLFATNGFIPFNLPWATVNSLLAMPNGDIFAGGHELATSSGGPSTLLARWSNSAWSAVSPALSAGPLYGPSLPNIGMVDKVVVLNDGEIVAGGVFFLNPDDPPTYIARWDGTNWNPLGDGVDGWVHAMLVLSNGDLIVTGEFTSAGGLADTAAIARWDGSQWHAVGKGLWNVLSPDPGNFFPGFGFALAQMPNGDIVVGGSFNAVGNAAQADTPANQVARWDGSHWAAMGDGLNFQVNALAVMPGGDLIAGGLFTDTTNGTNPPASRIARWANSAWSPMGMGIDAGAPLDDNSVVKALAVASDGTLLVGGRFATANGNVSANLARWGCAVAAAGICCRGSICDSSLTTQAACAAAANPPALWSTLGESCNSTANYSTPCCSADYDKNNVVNVSDIFAFLRGWFAHSTFANANQTGSVDVADIFAFLRAWFSTNGHCSTY